MVAFEKRKIKFDKVTGSWLYLESATKTVAEDACKSSACSLNECKDKKIA